MTFRNNIILQRSVKETLLNKLFNLVKKNLVELNHSDLSEQEKSYKTKVIEAQLADLKYLYSVLPKITQIEVSENDVLHVLGEERANKLIKFINFKKTNSSRIEKQIGSIA